MKRKYRIYQCLNRYATVEVDVPEEVQKLEQSELDEDLETASEIMQEIVMDMESIAWEHDMHDSWIEEI